MGNITANNAGGSCTAEEKYVESMSSSSGTAQNRKWFIKGLYDGIPIAAGYFAVSFALGIAAKTAGLNVVQATLTSFLCNASAGEYAGFTVIASNAPYVEMAVITLIVNARYLLMSAALSQKFSSSTPFYHRLLVSFCVTDEIFGASVTVPGKLNPFYNYGLAVNALGFWSLGTCLGVIMGDVLPPIVVNALGVALFGMFLWIIIPPARKNRVLAALILISMALSFAFRRLAVFSSVNDGVKTIILTVAIAAAAALLFPVETDAAGNPVRKRRGESNDA